MFARLTTLLFFFSSFPLMGLQHVSSVEIGTDSLRRGLSITERQASIKVGTHLEFPFGLYSALSVTNTGEKEAMGFLMEFNLGYGLCFHKNWKLSPEVRGFLNPFILEATTFEGGLSLSFLENHTISLWYSPHYFATGSYTLYGSIQSGYYILDSLKAEGAVGYQFYGDTNKASQTSYVDTKWSLWHLRGDHAIGFSFSITSREKIDVDTKAKKPANDWAFMGQYRFKIGS